jgi:hypothetical protein
VLWHIYVALLPAGSIRSFPLAHPSGFPSMSPAPANSIVEDFRAREVQRVIKFWKPQSSAFANQPSREATACLEATA